MGSVGRLELGTRQIHLDAYHAQKGTGRRFYVGLLLLVCVSAATIWSITSVGGHRSSSPVKHNALASGDFAGDPRSLTPITREPPQQTRYFALLRVPPEGLPALARSELRHPTFGLNWNLARSVPVPKNTPGEYWIVPGNGYVCTIWQVGNRSVTSTACATNQQAQVDGLLAINLEEPPGKPGHRLIVGVAPDGIRKVLVETAGSTATSTVGKYGVYILSDKVMNPPDRVVPITSHSRRP
jgi:hypothetical protein